MRLDKQPEHHNLKIGYQGTCEYRSKFIASKAAALRETLRLFSNRQTFELKMWETISNPVFESEGAIVIGVCP